MPLAAPAASSTARLTAERIRYEGGIIIAEGASGVRLDTADTHIQAESIRLDTIKRTVSAAGAVTVERSVRSNRNDVVKQGFGQRRRRPQLVNETLRGQNLQLDFGTGRGSLDNVVLQLADFTISTGSLLINGKRYVARNVIIRPGGLSPDELKIYGTPPLSIRVDSVTIDAANKGKRESATVKGGGLYFKNTKILPIPSYILRSTGLGGRRSSESFSLTPRIAFNSTDKILLTTSLQFPLSQNPSGAFLRADLGLSQRIGVRGGLSLEAPNKLGTFSLRARHADIVTTQLTNRIELDREPEVAFNSSTLPLTGLPGGRRLGLVFGAGYGRFNERTIGSNAAAVRSARSLAEAVLTTRAVEKDGPYLDLFARYANYEQGQRYRNSGFEVGYYGNISSRVRGLFSYRATTVSGTTPFRFDRVEIARELRTTFDVQLSPRYLVPIDLRYDLGLRRLRDERFGLLRSYKTFAYGLTYQTARRELKLEFRQGF